MTVTGDAMTSLSSESATSSKKSDASQNFLRAARAGNLSKLLDLFTRFNVDIHSCNANGLNALHLASKEGHTEIVRELLSRGTDPNRATKKGNTALHIASLAGQFEVVKMLLDTGAQVNVQAQNGFTPLYMAAQENHLEVVKLLLAHQSNPALTTDDGFTPLAVALQQGHDRIVALLLENDSRGKVCLPALHIAAKKDDVKAANLLLNSDVNVDHQSASGFTPLHIAAHYGNVNMTDLLISRGANINFQAKNNITPLHVACKWGNHGVAERLIAAGAELDCRTRDGLTPLHCAARSGHDTVVQLLLGANANYSAKTRSGLNALHMAAQGDHVDSVRLLLQSGLPLDDTTIDYLTPLHVAAHCGNLQVAKVLLERGCDVNARALNGFTPLHIACQKNRIKIVELLLKHGCMLEATTESGLTPLHVASFMGHLSIIVLLLQHGANPNAPTIRSETALHLAARSGQMEVARLLLRNGAQVDARARGNQTALHIASRVGSTDLVGLLLDHSANVHAATKDTYTPLHLAAKANHTEICRLLIQAGAQLETVTKSGFTPLHLAAKHTHVDTVQLLIERGANVNATGRNGLTPLHLATHYGSLVLVRVLLEHKANPLAQAKNGYTPLHIAAERRLLDVAKLVIAAGCETESRNGFTALHLASQDGSPEMVKLLLAAGARVNARAKNGLTPMHLAAQEDSLAAAELLCAAGSELDARTKAGYTPLHTACHFGQVNMIRFLLGKGVDVNATTCMGSNALHLAAQQGHSKVIYILLESGANPNMRNKNGWTPGHVARRQHYLNIFEVLRQVTTCVESWEADDEELLEPKITDSDLGRPMLDGTTKFAPGTRIFLEQPDVMGDHAVTDTEEECLEPDYTVIPASPLFSRSASSGQAGLSHMVDASGFIGTRVNGRMKSGGVDKMSTVSGEDSIHDDAAATAAAVAAAVGDHGRVNGIREPAWSSTRIRHDFTELGSGVLASSQDWDFTPDNVPIARKPVTSGFLVSFLVDARGGSMRGSRHPGLRVLVPPSAASAPTRITCRMLRPERTTRPPQLNDSEGLACRIIELGPHPCTFNTPVILEIPHFASLRGRQRELVVLRSDNAETWREHSLEATDQAVQSTLGQSFDQLETLEELREKRIIRILTNEFPQYLAVVSRMRQETALIGSDGGVLSSTVVPQVQAVFPEGALQKRIRVGLQAHPIPTEMVTHVLGNRVAASPIVTLEPRRRKFHKPITLTIPLPRSAMKGMLNPAGVGDLKAQTAPSLRLLCSITGGTLPAQWEDITGSTPLSKVKDCVSFTTTVSARFWLIDCQAVHESTELAGQLYREASLVPYMGKFVVFTKRLDTDEALIRCFCVTDDKVDKTLECQEGFEVCAASPEVEVVEGRPAWLEAAGNLLPVAKSDEQLRLHFNAFHENRLAFPVRLRDMQQEASGKLAFMREPRQLGGDSVNTEPQRPICTLEVHLGPEQGGIRAANSITVDPALASLAEQHQKSTGASLHSIPCVFPIPGRKLVSEDADYQNGYEDGVDVLGPEGRWASVYAADVIARSQLDLLQVAAEIGSDWPRLVGVLIPESGLNATCTVGQLVEWIAQNDPRWQETRGGDASTGLGAISVSELRTERDRALAVLLAWREQRGEQATGNELDRSLRAIGRMDVVKSCMLDIRCVTEPAEHDEAIRRIDEQGYGEDRTPRPLGSPEPTSASLVGTATLMSGMDDLLDHTMAQGVLEDHMVTAHAEPVDQNTLTAEKSHIVESIAPFHLREEEENMPSDAHTSTQESDGVTDTGLGITLTDAEHPVLKAEETEVDFEETVTQGHPGYGPDTEADEELEAAGAGTEDHWESGSPPATTTSHQGGDPLVTQADPDNEVDHVCDSESMTASLEGHSAQMTEDGGTQLLAEATGATEETGPTGGHAEIAPGSEPSKHTGQSDDETGSKVAATNEEESKPKTPVTTEEVRESTAQNIEYTVAQSEISAVHAGDDEDQSGITAGLQSAKNDETHRTESTEAAEGMSRDREEPGVDGTVEDSQDLRNAHHDGGARPPSSELGNNVTYYSEEHNVDTGDVHAPSDGEVRFSGQLMNTAHHGVETGAVFHPPPEHSLIEE